MFFINFLNELYQIIVKFRLLRKTAALSDSIRYFPSMGVKTNRKV